MISTTGRRPPAAAPIAIPMSAFSEIGVSRTRSAPNSSCKPGGHLEDAARGRDVLAEEDDRGVAPQLLGEALAHGLAVGQRAGLGRGLAGARRIGCGLRERRVDVLAERAGIGERALARGRDRTRDLGIDRGGEFALGLVVPAGQLREALARQDERVAQQPRRDLRLRPVGAGIVARVAAVPVGLGLDERRAAAAAGTLDRLRRDRAHRGDVVAVDDAARNAIGGGAVGEVREQARLARRRELPVEVVLAHEDRPGAARPPRS